MRRAIVVTGVVFVLYGTLLWFLDDRVTVDTLSLFVIVVSALATIGALLSVKHK